MVLLQIGKCIPRGTYTTGWAWEPLSDMVVATMFWVDDLQHMQCMAYIHVTFLTCID